MPLSNFGYWCAWPPWNRGNPGDGCCFSPQRLGSIPEPKPRLWLHRLSPGDITGSETERAVISLFVIVARLSLLSADVNWMAARIRYVSGEVSVMVSSFIAPVNVVCESVPFASLR